MSVIMVNHTLGIIRDLIEFGIKAGALYVIFEASTGTLTAWLVRRELACYDGPDHYWDCALHAYAAARDAVCEGKS